MFTRAHIDRIGREIADRRLDRPLWVAISETSRLYGLGPEGLKKGLSEIDRSTCSEWDCKRLDTLIKTVSIAEGSNGPS